MNISGIGVQQILPQTGTGSRDPNPAMEESVVTKGDQPSAKPDRAAPAPGTGKVVDKTA